MKNRTALTLTRGAMVAALYVALTYVSAIFGLSSGAIQLRLSEMLTVLPAFLPEAIPGLYIGCLIANLLTTGNVYDILLGSLATLIGAFGARMLRKTKRPMLIALPTVLANALIVPLVIILQAGGGETFASFPYFFLTVGIGEFLSAALLGAFFYRGIEKSNILPKI